MATHPGPAWLGIGAQRSGTTWLTDLLVQHPQVGLGTNGKKEQHGLQRIARGALEERAYQELFPRDGLLRGDFTPRYLNNGSVLSVAARLIADDAPVVVILRDPVERFASAMRKRAKQRRSPWPYEAALAYGQWTGMYAAQLALWEQAVGADRLVVVTYEEAVGDPLAACSAVWDRLGLPPAPLSDVTTPSGSSAGDAAWAWPSGLREALTTLYAGQLGELADRWGVRTELWRSFATAAVAVP